MLCPRLLPLREEASRAGWSPDKPGACCGRCGHSVGPGEATDTGCGNCRGRVLAWDSVVRLGVYEDPLRRWVLALKDQRIHRFGRDLGAMLGRAVEHAGILEPDERSELLVAPIPVPWARRVRRGVDHTWRLARAAADELGASRARLLTARPHRPQRGLPGEERQSNVAGVFQRRRSSPLSGRTVLLIDDVLTTGSTARAATLALTGRQDLRYARSPEGPTKVILAVVCVAEGHGSG